MSLEQVLAALDKINNRLAALENKVGGGGGGHVGASAAAAPAAGAGGEGRAASAFQALIDEHLAQFVALSEKLGGDVAALAPLVVECAKQSKALIQEASNARKPGAGEVQVVLKPLSEAIQAVKALQSKSRAANQRSHVESLGSGIDIFGWVSVEPAPGPFAAEMKDSAKFWSDKILREFKGKDETQVGWVHAWMGFLEALPAYIKQYHTTGLTWNPKGEAPKAPAGGDASKPAAAPAAKPAAGPAAPAAADAAPTKAGAALFSELNKGDAITSGLKKVTRDQTNKDKQISGKVEEKGAGKAAAAAPAKPPKCELQGNKWTVEYQVNTADPVVVKTSAKNQTVYVYKCENAVIVVEGKVNSIALDGCKKSSVVFDECVATFEVTNCTSVKIQVKQKVPVVAIDKTNGIQLFLPESSLTTEIISASSSEMNVCIPNPKKGPEDDLIVELPIPEQFKTVIKNNQLVTERVDHSGN